MKVSIEATAAVITGYKNQNYKNKCKNYIIHYDFSIYKNHATVYIESL